MSVLKASLRSSIARDVASKPFHSNIYDISLPERFLRIRRRIVSYLQGKICAAVWLAWRHLSFLEVVKYNPEGMSASVQSSSSFSRIFQGLQTLQ